MALLRSVPLYQYFRARKSSRTRSVLYLRQWSPTVPHPRPASVHLPCPLWQQVFPIKTMVAGISCGLVTGETDDDYIVLTDIQGLEGLLRRHGLQGRRYSRRYHCDPDGYQDPRFNTPDHPRETIRRCREARLYIMDNIMAPVISEPRKDSVQVRSEDHADHH